MNQEMETGITVNCGSRVTTGKESDVMYKEKWKKGTAVFLAALTLAAGPVFPEKARADAVDTPYIALGADLTAEQRATVLDLLGVTEADLENYTVVTVTNQEEHEYLDSYLDASVIGTKALSSVVVEKQAAGEGIQVRTSNITYCTTGMYQNALATAGLQDAQVRVAGPTNISGTAALVGAMKAYGAMTGEEVAPENADAATDELVTTSELGETLGDQDKAEALIGAVKDTVVAQEADSPQEIEAIIDDTAQQLEIQLSDDDRAQIASLMEKISDLDLDVDALKEQASDLYDKLESMDIHISKEQVKGFLGKLADWLGSLWDAISGLF